MLGAVAFSTVPFSTVPFSTLDLFVGAAVVTGCGEVTIAAGSWQSKKLCSGHKLRASGVRSAPQVFSQQSPPSHWH